MNPLPCLLLASCLGWAEAAQAALLSVGALIPDGESSGLASVQSLSGLRGPIAFVTLRLNISGVGEGAFNGDLYAALQHGTGFAVILNRPGRTESTPFGYADNGLDVRFEDRPESPDVHTYRLGGVPTGALTGVWSTDGRLADPASVTAESPRLATLDVFKGLDPNGQWVLFVADLESGGTARLDSWDLQIAIVPEPSAARSATAAGLLTLVAWRSRRFLDSSGTHRQTNSR